MAYVLLGGIHANAERWEEVEKVEVLRKAAGARKKVKQSRADVASEGMG